MLADWTYIGIFILVALFVPAIAITFAAILSPRVPGTLKQSAYECGMESVGKSWIQYKSQYYIFALVFLVFDVEIVFLYPFAIAYNQLTLFAVLEVILFLLILVAGLVYIWRKGELEWA
ncbi:MAG: NAD(P)H-quinone oxidoreductase subunit 3 [Anaerolineae bacterium]|jgi:NADH:ubiquinone oxidoreductase subunit 3 (subunit A)|nr:NAD(P)H-quinone oxidoreductase subunit 3 [Anaerolineae bacterium]